MSLCKNKFFDLEVFPSKNLILFKQKKASDLEILFKVFAGPQYKELSHHFEKKVNFKNLKYYYIDNFEGNLLASDLSIDSKNAIHKVFFII